MRTLVLVLSLLLVYAQNTSAQTTAPVQAEVKRDVIYVPTPQPVVDVMLRLANISSRDRVYDLGSGDGRIIITAARLYGASGVGIDIDPARIAESNENAQREGVSDRVEFIQGDLFETDLRPATVITLYLLPSLNVRLRPKLLNELRPGTPIVSHAFDMGDWEPDEALEVDGSRVFFWRVPAEVGGEWEATLKDGQGERTLRLLIDQSFQKVSGTAEGDHTVNHALSGRIDGTQIELTLATPEDGLITHHLSGQIEADVMNGTLATADNPGVSQGSWIARRTTVTVQRK